MLYTDLARYYDRIYHRKDYRADCDAIERIVAKVGRSTGKRLLDVGCGTGSHIEQLSARWECTGIDNEEAMLEVARAKVPSARFVQGDMRSFDLRERYDVVICMFSTIGYATTEQELKWTIENMSRHLVEGGVLVIEPWIVKEGFKGDAIALLTYDGPDAKIARVAESRVEGDMTILDMHYLIGEPGQGVTHVHDRHMLLLFDLDRTTALMRAARLEPGFDKDAFAPGRGAVVGLRLPG
jgi:SAM-dependent methyltransferase